MWAGHTQFEGGVQKLSSFLQVGQKYATFNLGGIIWTLLQIFDQPTVQYLIRNKLQKNLHS